MRYEVYSRKQLYLKNKWTTSLWYRGPEPRTSNIAREAAMHAGLPHDIPAHTVSAYKPTRAEICRTE